jgi:hypothetical protein
MILFILHPFAFIYYFVRGEGNRVALMVRSCAARACEPGQVRKEAALSGHSWAPQGCLAGATRLPSP